MKFFPSYEEFINEEEIRFSGRYIPPQHQKNGYDGLSGKPNHISKPKGKFNTVRSKSTPEETERIKGIMANNHTEDSAEYTILSYAKQVRPFKEKVTAAKLLSRFDELGEKEVKKKLLLCLDATLLDNTIRLYIENQIVDAKNKLALANLVMKYTIDVNKKSESSGDFNFFKKFSINFRQHDRDDLDVLRGLR